MSVSRLNTATAVSLTCGHVDECHRGPKSSGFYTVGGGAERNRTAGLCSAIAALSHLSYSPERAAR